MLGNIGQPTHIHTRVCKHTQNGNEKNWQKKRANNEITKVKLNKKEK